MEGGEAIHEGKGNELSRNGGNQGLAQLYGGIDSLPTTFIIDRDGRIASEHNGLVSRSSYETEIVRLLKARSKGMVGLSARSGGATGSD